MGDGDGLGFDDFPNPIWFAGGCRFMLFLVWERSGRIEYLLHIWVTKFPFVQGFLIGVPLSGAVSGATLRVSQIWYLQKGRFCVSVIMGSTARIRGQRKMNGSVVGSILRSFRKCDVIKSDLLGSERKILVMDRYFLLRLKGMILSLCAGLWKISWMFSRASLWKLSLYKHTDSNGYSSLIALFLLSFLFLRVLYAFNILVFLFLVGFAMTQGSLLGSKGVGGKAPMKRISISKFDNSAIIARFAKTVIGRCLNPRMQDLRSLLVIFPKFWPLEGKVVGKDLGLGVFQFDFEEAKDIPAALAMEPFHFDDWMVCMEKWRPSVDPDYPSSITFWIRVLGIPIQYRDATTLKDIGKALGRVDKVDTNLGRVQVTLNAMLPLCFETVIVFDGGEESIVKLRYERLYGYCKVCGSLCHGANRCPQVVRDEPEEMADTGAINNGEKQHFSFKGAVLSERRKGARESKSKSGNKGKGIMESKQGLKSREAIGVTDKISSEPAGRNSKSDAPEQLIGVGEDRCPLDAQQVSGSSSTMGTKSKAVRKALFHETEGDTMVRDGAQVTGKGPTEAGNDPRVTKVCSEISKATLAAQREEEEYRKLVQHYEGVSEVGKAIETTTMVEEDAAVIQRRLSDVSLEQGEMLESLLNLEDDLLGGDFTMDQDLTMDLDPESGIGSADFGLGLDNMDGDVQGATTALDMGLEESSGTDLVGDGPGLEQTGAMGLGGDPVLETGLETNGSELEQSDGMGLGIDPVLETGLNTMGFGLGSSVVTQVEVNENKIVENKSLGDKIREVTGEGIKKGKGGAVFKGVSSKKRNLHRVITPRKRAASKVLGPVGEGDDLKHQGVEKGKQGGAIPPKPFLDK